MGQKVFKYYSYGDCPAEVDLPDQAYAIVQILKDHGGTLERTELLNILEKRLSGKQKVSRILSYYQKTLLENNCIVLDKRDAANKKAA
jgi:uncharacterized membrane protein